MQDLTPRQQRFAELRLDGVPPLRAARLAGFSDPGTSAIRAQAYKLERHPKVQQAIADMKRAICGFALARVRKRQKVSLFALELLHADPELPEKYRKMVFERLSFARVQDASARILAFAHRKVEGSA